MTIRIIAESPPVAYYDSEARKYLGRAAALETQADKAKRADTRARFLAA